MSSPLIEIRFANLKASSPAPCVENVRRGFKGRRASRPCTIPSRKGRNWFKMAWGVIKGSQPRPVKNGPSRHATTGTAHELPMSVNRVSKYSSPERACLPTQSGVYEGGNPHHCFPLFDVRDTERRLLVDKAVTMAILVRREPVAVPSPPAKLLLCTPAGLRPGDDRGLLVVKVGKGSWGLTFNHPDLMTLGLTSL